MKQVLMLWIVWFGSSIGTGQQPSLEQLEVRRIQQLAELSKSSVCVFSSDGKSGGSGVLIDGQGFALTNFHVVESCGYHLLCGLNDGNLYDGVVVGMDPVGDLALIKLLGTRDFPFARFAGTDDVQQGDLCYAIGNPFLLAHDFHPTVTRGIISGTHRYQYPKGTLLEYTDCLQTDAAINPGNSGGGLFNRRGELIGINGRASFEKRGRVSVGVGYSISINQVKNFLGSLKSGRLLDHSSLGLIVAEGPNRYVLVSRVLETSDAYRQGLRFNAEILSIAGRRTRSVNDVKNIVGTLPPHWKIPLVYRVDQTTNEVMVRLRELHSREELFEKTSANKLWRDGQQKVDTPVPLAVQKHYKPRQGYSNYFFNQRYTQDLLTQIHKRYGVHGNASAGVRFSGKTLLDNFQYVFEKKQSGLKIGNEFSTLLSSLPFETQTVPSRSGGLLNLLHIYHEMVFGSRDQLAISYLGTAPYVFGQEGRVSSGWNKRVLYDVLRVLRNGTQTLFYVDSQSRLVAAKYFPFPEANPCMVEFTGFERWASCPCVPTKILARQGKTRFAELRVKKLTRPKIGKNNPRPALEAKSPKGKK